MAEVKKQSEATNEAMRNGAFASTERLFELIEQRYHVLVALLESCKSSCLPGDNPDVLLRQVSHRQSLIENLSLVDSELSAYQADDPETRKWISQNRRQQCQEISNESGQLLKEIVSLEQANLEQFSEKRQAIADQLKNGCDSILANNAYQAGAQIEPTQLDVSDL